MGAGRRLRFSVRGAMLAVALVALDLAALAPALTPPRERYILGGGGASHVLYDDGSSAVYPESYPQAPGQRPLSRQPAPLARQVARWGPVAGAGGLTLAALVLAWARAGRRSRRGDGAARSGS